MWSVQLQVLPSKKGRLQRALTDNGICSVPKPLETWSRMHQLTLYEHSIAAASLEVPYPTYITGPSHLHACFPATHPHSPITHHAPILTRAHVAHL